MVSDAGDRGFRCMHGTNNYERDSGHPPPRIRVCIPTYLARSVWGNAQQGSPWGTLQLTTRHAYMHAPPGKNSRARDAIQFSLQKSASKPQGMVVDTTWRKSSIQGQQSRKTVLSYISYMLPYKKPDRRWMSASHDIYTPRIVVYCKDHGTAYV
jgi:hypothetical protein